VVSFRLGATCSAHLTLASNTDRPRSLGTIATVMDWLEDAGDADDDAGDEVAGAEEAAVELDDELDDELVTEQPASTTATAGSAASAVSRVQRLGVTAGNLLGILFSFGRD